MIRTVTDRYEWDDAVRRHQGHPLQLWGWGEVKAAHNWSVERVLVSDDDTELGGATLLVRRLPKPFGPLIYVPRGPFCAPENRGAVLDELVTYCKQYSPLALSVEPNWLEFPDHKGWRRAKNTILLPKTGVIDLTKSPEELLGTMAKKTRQYIRKSEREALEVRPVTSDEVADCLAVYKATAERAGFSLHDDAYYHDIFATMSDATLLYGAWYEGELVAFLWTVASDTVAFELYGGVTDQGQELRANYVLKWRVIMACKERRVQRYDLNGLLNDGISNFKQGFIEHETELAGTYDYAMSPLYAVWTTLLPTAKAVIRKLKK